MNPPRENISCFVVRPDAAGQSHEFLQLRRSANDSLAGTWQIIRGGIEPGETASQAALRELREEAGLAPVEFYRLASIESFYLPETDSIWHCPAFCAIVSGESIVTLNEEHDAARWVPRALIDSQTTWASERRALVDLCRDVLDDGLARPLLRMDVSKLLRGTTKPLI